MTIRPFDPSISTDLEAIHRIYAGGTRPGHASSTMTTRTRPKPGGRRTAALCLILSCLAGLAGCAGVEPPPSTPALLQGTVQLTRPTGWVIDYCGDHRLVPIRAMSGSSRCLALGGEISEARMSAIERIDGSPMPGSLRIAFPNHGLRDDVAHRHQLVLLPAKPDFAAATGIGFVAVARDNYDARRQCLTLGEFAHLDRRDCPDRSFHERQRGQCLPVADYLAHFAAQP